VAPDQLYANGGVAEQSVDPLALDWLTDRDLAFLVERLPLPQRQVLVLRYMLDFSYTEIALALDRSIDDVRQLHHRARRHLEERLRRLGHAPRVARDVERCRTFVKQATVLRTRRFGLTRNATLRRLQGR
jgi:DNA-directed RNA polymerase specialized sigma24 family protein